MIRKAGALLSAMTKAERGTENFFCMHKKCNEIHRSSGTSHKREKLRTEETYC